MTVKLVTTRRDPKTGRFVSKKNAPKGASFEMYDMVRVGNRIVAVQ